MLESVLVLEVWLVEVVEDVSDEEVSAEDVSVDIWEDDEVADVVVVELTTLEELLEADAPN